MLACTEHANGNCCFLEEQFRLLHGLSDLHLYEINSSTSSGVRSHPLGSRTGANLFSVSSFSQPN